MLLQTGAMVSASTSAAMFRELSPTPRLASWMSLAAFQPTKSQRVFTIFLSNMPTRISLLQSRLDIFSFGYIQSHLPLHSNDEALCYPVALRKEVRLIIDVDLADSSNKLVSGMCHQIASQILFESQALPRRPVYNMPLEVLLDKNGKIQISRLMNKVGLLDRGAQAED